MIPFGVENRFFKSEKDTETMTTLSGLLWRQVVLQRLAHANGCIETGRSSVEVSGVCSLTEFGFSKPQGAFLSTFGLMLECERLQGSPLFWLARPDMLSAFLLVALHCSHLNLSHAPGDKIVNEGSDTSLHLLPHKITSLHDRNLLH